MTWIAFGDDNSAGKGGWGRIRALSGTNRADECWILVAVINRFPEWAGKMINNNRGDYFCMAEYERAKEPRSQIGMKIQIPIFYKLLVSMLIIALLPILLLGIVLAGGTRSIMGSIGLESTIFIITVVTVSIILMWSFFLAARITNPIVKLSNVATRISRGDLKNTEINMMSNDEIGELVTAFNKLINTYKILDTLAKEESGH
jgi:HAMP domain-containing protein